MIRHKLLLAAACLLAVVLVAASINPSSRAGAVSAAARAEGLRLQAAGEGSVEFEISVPTDLLELGPVAADGTEYVQVSLPGWAGTRQAGAPDLPYVLNTVAAPFGAQIRVEVEPGRVVRMALPARVKPVATVLADWTPESLVGSEGALPAPVRVLVEDEAVYGSAVGYPGPLAEVVSDGVVRQQRLVGIAAYPLQYEPATGELVVYESLLVRLTFEGGDGPASAAVPWQESAVYEDLLSSSVLNPESAQAWARPSLEARVPEALPWAPPEPGYRVYVEEEGIYKITYGELDAAQVPVASLDPATLRMYADGQEIAIHVEGEADDTFHTDDYVLFYGQALNSKYTAENVYWLTYGGDPGLRMGSRDGTPASGTVPGGYGASVHLEDDSFYIPGLPGDEDLERYIWSYLYPPSTPSWSHTFSLPEPATGVYSSTLELSLFGFLQSPVQPDHHVEVYVNDTFLADLWWDGIAHNLASFDFPQSILKTGSNTLKLVAPNDSGAGSDIVHIDWATLGFTSTFTAAGDILGFDFGTVGAWKYEVGGFTLENVVVFDVTDPADVQWITGGSVTASAPTFNLSFSDTVVDPARYWTMDTSKYLAPLRIEADTPSNLRSQSNGADYVVVTHAAFSTAVAPLAAYRAGQGLRVVQVDVQDAYDEFGYGVVSPGAIRDFLEYTYLSWQRPAPTYVLLVGDGHYDPKNHEGWGKTSWIPPYLAPVDPWIRETAADNRYVSFTVGDQLPEMLLGRLAVGSTAEATAIVDKTLAYEQDAGPADWTQSVLLVADNADLGGDFAYLSDELDDCCLPEPYDPDKVYYGVTHPTVSGAQTGIRTGINAGQLFVNYIGHAAVTGWAEEQLFLVSDISSLTNEGKLPVMLPMTCYDGYYHYPFPTWGHSTAESIVRAGGKGAVASWSPTGLGVATGHDQLNRGFFEAVFKDGVRTLGAATMAGKLRLAASGSNLDLLDSYLLFGDPALRIKALDTDLQIEKAVQPSGVVEQGQVLTYTLTFSNTGPAMAHSVALTDVVPAELVSPTVVYSSSNVLNQKPGAPFAWRISDLSPGEGGEIQFTATVPLDAQPASFTVKNEAEITMAEPDTDPSNNRASTSTSVFVPGSIWRIYLPLVSRRHDPMLYDDFEDAAYDNAFSPTLWDQGGNPAYEVRQWGGSLGFNGDLAPAYSGADMYLIQPLQRSLSEVGEFQAKLKFSSGQVGGYASVKIQTTADVGSAQGWWTQCTLAAADSVAPSIVCDVSSYDGASRTTEYLTPVVPAGFDTWYAVRIEADPDTAQLSFYLDDVLIGTHLPRDAAALLAATDLSPKVGVWNGAAGTTAARYVDQVRITPARR